MLPVTSRVFSSRLTGITVTYHFRDVKTRNGIFTDSGEVDMPPDDLEL